MAFRVSPRIKEVKCGRHIQPIATRSSINSFMPTHRYKTTSAHEQMNILPNERHFGYGKPTVAIFNTMNSFNPILISIQCNSPIHSIQYIYMNSIQFNPYIHSIQSSNSFNSIHIYEFSSIQSLNSFNPILKFIPFNTCI